jgi:hypothetical protein
MLRHGRKSCNEFPDAMSDSDRNVYLAESDCRTMRQSQEQEKWNRAPAAVLGISRRPVFDNNHPHGSQETY